MRKVTLHSAHPDAKAQRTSPHGSAPLHTEARLAATARRASSDARTLRLPRVVHRHDDVGVAVAQLTAGFHDSRLLRRIQLQRDIAALHHTPHARHILYPPTHPPP